MRNGWIAAGFENSRTKLLSEGDDGLTLVEYRLKINQGLEELNRRLMELFEKAGLKPPRNNTTSGGFVVDEDGLEDENNTESKSESESESKTVESEILKSEVPDTRSADNEHEHEQVQPTSYPGNARKRKAVSDPQANNPGNLRGPHFSCDDISAVHSVSRTEDQLKDQVADLKRIIDSCECKMLVDSDRIDKLGQENDGLKKEVERLSSLLDKSTKALEDVKAVDHNLDFDAGFDAGCLHMVRCFHNRGVGVDLKLKTLCKMMTANPLKPTLAKFHSMFPYTDNEVAHIAKVYPHFSLPPVEKDNIRVRIKQHDDGLKARHAREAKFPADAVKGDDADVDESDSIPTASLERDKDASDEDEDVEGVK